jgi:hypothetical protein
MDGEALADAKGAEASGRADGPDDASGRGRRDGFAGGILGDDHALPCGCAGAGRSRARQQKGEQG